MKTKYLTGLLLLMVACSGGKVTGEGGDEKTLQLKKAAAEASANANANANDAAQGDACQVNGWYGDGECDKFCSNLDSVDCTPISGGPAVACALFLEESNGFCSRKVDDPCIAQDPDCETMPPLPGDEPVACTAIGRPVDGICPPDDVCALKLDPDCAGNEPVACTAIDRPADGVCPPDDICALKLDPDCVGSAQPTTPGIDCPAIALAADGVCSYDGKDFCDYYNDPDCAKVEPVPPDYPSDPGVACDQYLEVSDGVCKRAADDPCIFQDPDCQMK